MAYLQNRQEIAKQIQSNRYIDGTFEIQAGANGILLGLFQVATAFPMLHITILSQIPFDVQLFLPFIFIIAWIIVVYYFLPKYLTKIQERLSNQRTSFVNFGISANSYKQNNNVIIGIILALLLVALIFISLVFVILFRLSIDFKLVNSLIFLILATIFPIGDFLIWYRTDVQRYVFAGLLALVLGAGLYVYFLNTWNFAYLNAPFGCYFIGIGLTELLLGLVTLRNYLRQYPIMSQVEE